MAPDSDQGTEQPTSARRRQARREGRVVQSRDLVAAASLLAALMFLSHAGPGIFRRLCGGVEALLSNAFRQDALTSRSAAVAVEEVIGIGLVAFLPLALLIWATGALSGMVQTGFLIRAGAVAPDPRRVSPLSGLRRLGSPRAGGRGLFAVLKLGVLASAVAYGSHLVVGSEGELAAGSLVAKPLPLAANGAALELLRLSIFAALALFFLAVLDWFFQRWQLERELRMSRREILEEQKEQEAPPEVKRRGWQLRKRQLKRWSQRSAGHGETGGAS